MALGDRLLDRDATKALDAYLHAYSQDPYRAEVLSRLGDTFLRLGNVPKAIQHYQRALEANAGFGPAYPGLAEALQRSGNAAEAKRTLEAYLERFPTGSLRARIEEMLRNLP
jgi:tetratricopeptide (TPR) repeat protein